MIKSICYLSDDFRKHSFSLPPDTIICPESTKNEEQILNWILELKTNPKIFFTCSLFLIRELEIQKIDVEWVNITEKGVVSSSDVNDIGNIEILDRELRQADRYMNFGMGFET